ncbi:MAG: hypothetical protein ABJH52_08270 [Henriciella sp.]
MINLAKVIIAIAIAMLALTIGFGGGDIDTDEFALGTNNQLGVDRLDGQRVHCQALDTAGECIQASIARGYSKRLVWLGNSQLHAINQSGEGDVTAPVLLADKLRQHEIDAVSFSQPNANFLEHQIVYHYLKQKLDPEILVLPAVFDDTREEQIRDDILLGIQEPTVLQDLAGTKSLTIAQAEGGNYSGTSASERQNLQSIVEDELDAGLSSVWTGWAAREEARSAISIALYRLRNSILGIKPTSKRKKIPSRYIDNLLAFEQLVCNAVESDILTIVYIAPIRNDYAPPYIASEYEGFRSDVHNITRDCSAHFVNLENLVPNNLWGTKEATTVGGEPELDFMHFQFPGHVILADEIEKQVLSALK